MIKNHPLRLNTDQRGFISSGRLVDGKPRSVAGFVLDDFPELEEIYGRDPSTLYITFPVNDLTTVFDDEYCAWATSKAGNSTKKRVCDGEDCTHRIDETFCGQRFAAGEVSPCACLNLPDDHKEKCKYSAALRAMILHPETKDYASPIVYTFRTHSIHSGGSLRAELIKALGLTGRLVGHQFEISVRIVTSKLRAGSKFPIWNLNAVVFGEAASMLEGGDERFALGTGSALADELEDAEPTEKETTAPAPKSNGTPKTTATKESAPAQAPPAYVPTEAQSTAVRDAHQVREVAKRMIGADETAHPTADGPLRVRALGVLNALTGSNEKRNLAVIAYLFGITDISEINTAEAAWLIDWIAPKKGEGGTWLIWDVTLKEAALVYRAAVAELPALFKSPESPAEPAPTTDTSEPFPDGFDAYGNEVSPQAELGLGGEKLQPDPATL